MIDGRKLEDGEEGFDGGKSVVVAVKLSKVIPRGALVWALAHVVQPGGLITLLVVVPSQNPGRKLWGLPKFAGDCGSGHRRFPGGNSMELRSDIAETCSQLMLQLQSIYDPDKTKVKIKIVGGAPPGAVAAEAKRAQASWVVMDKHLKHEEKRCMEELQCNIVAMKRSRPKILRLNLVGHPRLEADGGDRSESVRGPVVSPSSSPEPGTSFTTEAGASSVSSCDLSASPFFPPKLIHRLKKDSPAAGRGSDSSSSGSEAAPAAKALAAKFSKLDRTFRSPEAADIREAISLTRSAAQVPPPLCSRCQHKAPVFGKPPRWFCFSDLEAATNGFSEANFLAEGGFGSVHRGVLPDGRVVAVKQHRLASSQGDNEFCSEVEVLSCAQHRNVVTLIGFCVEDRRRLLVYEFICNGSLDSHLYGRKEKTLAWWARQKIAVGAARGLRYLHEECRVGCIVHRDMRPNNILITHDFEPLVGDFGLARWQPDGDRAVETRVIGTFGYLAPEYAQSGQITEKADVYSFGVVLVELVTGRKAVDINRPKGQQCLTEWARPLLEELVVEELIDPSLGGRYAEEEVCRMLHAAALCIRRDPEARPRMSQVLRILDGDGAGLQKRPQTWGGGEGPSFRRRGGGGGARGVVEGRLSSEALLAAYREKSRR
ncbi:inactive protein kinase SELMODRAFT_444075-like [Wolffia australiana]